ncbi:hypothetical protein [Parasitella parasitica]|uniref:Protein kinase domain-containing protein n=1 Tax=Parasitella parasitica TaxID=35722 RepID=A0A0B7MU92_9FUNG|nr:hypothetical protein [Parasitella parasitica]
MNQHNVYSVYLTDTSQNGTYWCIISFVSGHINFLYIQRNNDDNDPTEFTKPNVLALVASHENEEGKFAYFPLYPGGTLMDRIEDNFRNGIRMSEKNAIFFLQQLLSGLEPQNILLSEHHLKRPRLIIADFGLSMQKSQMPTYWKSDYGTESYHSPEMICSEPFDEKIDSWAAGVVFYNMLTNQNPFPKEDDTMLSDKESVLGKKLDLANDLPGISPTSKNLIMHLLEKDQSKRYTAKQANKTRWLFIYWKDNKAVQESFLAERQYWFHDGPSNKENVTNTTMKKQRSSYHFDDDIENVEFITQLRNPFSDGTFLKGKHAGFDPDYHQDFIDKINAYKDLEGL